MTKGAVIIETRLINISEILENHFRYLPKDWSLHFFGSKHNEHLFNNISRSVVFHKLPDSMVDNFNTETYNNLITSRGFWESIPCEKILIFQHDSKLLREGIEEFLEWDYIGAPWGHFNMLGGNGGLSIRTKQKMLEVIDHTSYRSSIHGNEDVYFCRYLPKVGCKIAPRDIAKTFSVETVFYPTPIGVHAPEKYLSKHQLEILYNV